jgi:hypothetical protein
VRRFRTALYAIAIVGVIAATALPTARPSQPAVQVTRADGHLVAPAQLGPSAPRYPSKNTDGQAGSGGRATVFKAGGRLISDAAQVARAPEALLWRTGYGSWEPTVGVNAKGAVFFSARNANNDPGIARSRDGGKTWQPAGPPEHRVSLDPYVWVDRATGRLFASDVDPSIQCSPISYSDDEGATWKTARGCGVADHQSLFGGPARKGAAATDGYPNPLYYCAIAKGATTVAPTEAGCLRSLDGGDTWNVTGSAFPPRVNGTAQCGGFHGHGTVGPDGAVYLPAGWCGKPHLAISHDEGATWKQVQISEIDARSHEAGIVADADNNLYYTWVAGDEKPYLSISRDGGKTWGKPLDINPPGVHHIDGFAASIDAGDPGRIAVVFMATQVKDVVDTTPWNAYVISSVNALDADPTFYSTTINDPETNALHRGTSCCGNVGDFIDVAIGPEGTAWAALVDTCTSPEDECIYSDAGLVTEPRGEGVVGQVVGGPPLVGSPADQRPSVSIAPYTVPPARGCVGSREIVVRVGKPRRGKVTQALVFVDGKRKKVLRGNAVRRPYRLRGLSAGRHRVRVVVRTTSGRSTMTTRTYRVCG